MTYTEVTAADSSQCAEKPLDTGAQGDFSLVAAIAARSETQNELFVRYRRPLLQVFHHRRIARDVADDLLQRTFLQVIKKIRAEGLDDPGNLGGYLYRTACKLAAAYWRGELSHHHDNDGAVLSELSDEALTLEERLDHEQLAKHVRDLMDHLPVKRDREVLERFFRMDLDQGGTLDQKEWDRHAEVFRRAQNAIVALRPSGNGELSDGDVVWKYQRGIPYVATPLVHQGKVWMVKDGGIVTRLDAVTGKVLSEERLPALGGYYASPVTGDGKVYFASEAGVVSVVSAANEWKVISKHDFRERIYATPVISDGRIYIRTEKALYCFSKQ